eukprot:14473516-Alexandrium_andersonii.AAC.1
MACSSRGPPTATTALCAREPVARAAAATATSAALGKPPRGPTAPRRASAPPWAPGGTSAFAWYGPRGAPGDEPKGGPPRHGPPRA